MIKTMNDIERRFFRSMTGKTRSSSRLLHSRKLRRRQEATGHPFVDRPVLLTVRSRFNPLRIEEEGIPLLLTICQAVPGEEIDELVAAVWANELCPGSGQSFELQRLEITS